MATYCVSRDSLTWFVVRARRALLSACTVALVSCGGGQSGPAAPIENAGPTLPAPTPAPAQLVVGTALSIDNGASGNPVSLRVARSANGDGFAVWQADDGTRRNLWANRYDAATAAWGNPINIEANTDDIGEFDLTVDANGNATVAWSGAMALTSTRFDAGAGAWAAPIVLGGRGGPRLASDATGAVLVYGNLYGRFFDPVSGTWQPEVLIGQSTESTGISFGGSALLDGSGNALFAFHNAREGVGGLASNYFSRSTGSWGQLPPDSEGESIGEVPGSFLQGFNDNVQLAASAGGDFLMAWQANVGDSDRVAEIRIAHFTSRTRMWSTRQTVVPGSAQKNVQFQRIGSDARGNAFLLWTENDDMRTALKAVRLDPSGATCSAVQVIDRAVGGGAARADLGVDPLGNAIAIWQQFEGGRADDGSRSNIAINRFDRITANWGSAVLAETQPGDAFSPRASATGGQALLGWIQAEGGVNRVKALLQPLTTAARQ